MGGDQTVAKWYGDVYGTKIRTTTTVQRFSASSLRFKNVKIYNEHASYTAWIGQYYSSVVTFPQYALRIGGHETIEFEYIDLYTLGCKWDAGGYVDLHVVGINQY